MVYVMEPSVSKQLIFCCGNSRTNPSDACVAAITFNAALQRVAQRVFVGEGLMAATAMKRFKNADDLVLGCQRDMIIVRFVQGSGFDILNRIPNIHSSKYFFLDKITVFVSIMYNLTFLCRHFQ
jgi:hypothetical protein